MKLNIVLAMSAFVAFLGLDRPASAQVTSRTVYSYYDVSGNSLSELHRSMVRSGPTANGVRGYGVTSARPGKRMSAAKWKSGAGNFDLEFVIRLPSPASAAKLSGPEKSQWKRFVAFVKRHEETHRTIWMGCAAEYDRRLRTSGGGHGVAMRLWNQMVAACSPKQVAFDKAERRPLAAHPFMQLAKN